MKIFVKSLLGVLCGLVIVTPLWADLQQALGNFSSSLQALKAGITPKKEEIKLPPKRDVTYEHHLQTGNKKRVDFYDLLEKIKEGPQNLAKKEELSQLLDALFEKYLALEKVGDEFLKGAKKDNKSQQTAQSKKAEAQEKVINDGMATLEDLAKKAMKAWYDALGDKKSQHKKAYDQALKNLEAIFSGDKKAGVLTREGGIDAFLVLFNVAELCDKTIHAFFG